MISQDFRAAGREEDQERRALDPQEAEEAGGVEVEVGRNADRARHGQAQQRGEGGEVGRATEDEVRGRAC